MSTDTPPVPFRRPRRTRAAPVFPGRTRTRARRSAVLLALIAAACGEPAPGGSAPREVEVAAVPGAGPRLQALLDTLGGPARVRLAAGRYVLDPVAFTDSTCGNCEDPEEEVPATRGLRLRGRGIVLEGDTAAPSSVVLETRSGYGVLFDGCDGCALRGVSVTGGARDPDGRATSAGVVVREGAVSVEDCVVTGNLGDSAVVHGSTIAGVAGVAVREGADLTLRRCRILRNSWDGVALYRGARATIEDNLIDGVDAASGARHGGGRGVGIGATWDARATVVGNRITRYWKGIGAFVDADVVIRENVVEEVLTWGIAYWGPDGSRPRAMIRGNAVFGAGACGVMVDRAAPPEEGEDPGELTGNAVVRTGGNEAYDSGEPYCAQRPIARRAVPAGFEIEGNLVLDARQPGPDPREPEVASRAALARQAASLAEGLEAHGPTRASAFLRWLRPGTPADTAGTTTRRR